MRRISLAEDSLVSVAVVTQLGFSILLFGACRVSCPRILEFVSRGNEDKLEVALIFDVFVTTGLNHFALCENKKAVGVCDEAWVELKDGRFLFDKRSLSPVEEKVFGVVRSGSTSNCLLKLLLSESWGGIIY